MHLVINVQETYVINWVEELNLIITNAHHIKIIGFQILLSELQFMKDNNDR